MHFPAKSTVETLPIGLLLRRQNEERLFLDLHPQGKRWEIRNFPVLLFKRIDNLAALLGQVPKPMMAQIALKRPKNRVLSHFLIIFESRESYNVLGVLPDLAETVCAGVFLDGFGVFGEESDVGVVLVSLEEFLDLYFFEF